MSQRRDAIACRSAACRRACGDARDDREQHRDDDGRLAQRFNPLTHHRHAPPKRRRHGPCPSTTVSGAPGAVSPGQVSGRGRARTFSVSNNSPLSNAAGHTFGVVPAGQIRSASLYARLAPRCRHPAARSRSQGRIGACARRRLFGIENACRIGVSCPPRRPDHRDEAGGSKQNHRTHQDARLRCIHPE